MARSKKPRKKSKQPELKSAEPMDRRRALRLLRNGGIAAAVVAGAGVFGTRSVMATIAEHDLTRVGKEGKPIVVQIHDPNCPTCRALQRETRKALSRLEECAVVFLVANIATTDGAAFAARFGVPHVTLLLFDKDGAHERTISGMQQRDDLERDFRRLAGRPVTG